MKLGALVSWIIAPAALLSPALAQVNVGDPRQGHALAQDWCSSCHVVSPQQQQAGNDAVPSFSSIAHMPSTTATSLKAFLETPHPPMPDLKLSQAQIDDIIAYILCLRGH